MPQKCPHSSVVELRFCKPWVGGSNPSVGSINSTWYNLSMSKKILIVEDDESVQILLKLFLIRLSHSIVEAKNGLEGVGMARQFKPDLIIADLNMPILDGIGMLESLKQDESTKNIPVIIFTGSTAEQQQKALDAGATTVLSKPVMRQDLIQVVDSILSR